MLPPQAFSAAASLLFAALAVPARAGDSEYLRFLDPNAPAGPALTPQPEGGASEVPKNPLLSDRFFFGLGVYAPTAVTKAQLNSDVGVGATVDFEDALGLDSTDVTPQGLARWRMSDRWRMELEYFALNRSSTKVLSADVAWGDQTFTAGTSVDSTFDVSVARLSFGYSFFKTEDKEIGAALGFHITSFDASLETAGGSDEGGDVLAPLPVLSLYGQVALTDEWAFSARADAFKLVVDPYDGKIISMAADVTYQPWRHLGFGLGYRSLLIHAGVDGGDWDGQIDSSFQGAILFVYTSF